MEIIPALKLLLAAAVASAEVTPLISREKQKLIERSIQKKIMPMPPLSIPSTLNSHQSKERRGLASLEDEEDKALPTT